MKPPYQKVEIINNENLKGFIRAPKVREPSAEESFLDLFKKEIF